MHSQQIIHRDLKAENIMLAFSIPKIGDLGSCISFNKNNHSLCGTSEYMSPEMNLG